MGTIDPALWLFITLALGTLGFSAAMIAYQAWGGDLGVNTQERLQLTGSREAFILAGVVIAAVIPTAVDPDPLAGMTALPAWLFVFMVIAVVLCWKLPAGLQAVTHESLLSRLRLAWADITFRRLLFVFFANGIASSFPATLFIFYVADVLAAPEKTGLLLGSYFLAAALAVPFWVRCAQRWGRPAMWMVAMLLAMGSFMGAAFLGAGDWTWFLLICLVSGIAVGTDLTLPASMVADLGERHQSTGTYFGIWNLVAKMNLALAAGIALPLLGLFGYSPGAGDQHHVLVAAYVLLPIGLKTLALYLLYRWRHALMISA
jgi:Na+/melibiose symporter-like transporter